MATGPGGYTPWQSATHRMGQATLKDSSAYHHVKIELAGSSRFRTGDPQFQHEEDVRIFNCLMFKIAQIHPSHSIQLYRNNLIACSKRYNFLFIATRTKVRVFLPTYPSQTVCSPLLTLHGPEELSQLRNVGYISESPHTINNMIVADLGTEEVLLVANDSGYVTLWYTKHLIQRQGNMDIWFDVRKSAWGLAVHTKKRLIAISSNTTRIFVYEMGNEAIDPAKPPRGAENPIVLWGNHQNLPCVAFLQDDTGRWLTTTDIMGAVILYDLLRKKRTMASFNGQGWTVTFVSERSFLWVEHEELIKMIEKTREESERAVRRGMLSFAGTGDSYSDSDSEDWASDVQMTLYGGGSEEDEYQDGFGGQISHREDESGSDDNDDYDDEEMSDDEDSEIEMNFTALEEAIISHDAENPVEAEEEEGYGDEDGRDVAGETGEMEVTEEMQSTAYGPIPRYTQSSSDMNFKGPASKPSPKEEAEDPPWEYPPPSFIIHSKEFDLKLIVTNDPPKPSRPFMNDPRPVHLNSLITLRNLIPPDGITVAAQGSRFPLRMNMHAYIPALSLYVVGRQDGRAALVRMIRSRPPKAEGSSQRFGKNSESENGENKGVVHRHFMHLEHIIPQDIPIPFALAGVCVAPLQGWEDRDVTSGMGEGRGQRRWLYANGGVGGKWRIFLLYSDGVVISYTVSGGIPAHENGAVF